MNKRIQILHDRWHVDDNPITLTHSLVSLSFLAKLIILIDQNIVDKYANEKKTFRSTKSCQMWTANCVLILASKTWEMKIRGKEKCSSLNQGHEFAVSLHLVTLLKHIRWSEATFSDCQQGGCAHSLFASERLMLMLSALCRQAAWAWWKQSK